MELWMRIAAAKASTKGDGFGSKASVHEAREKKKNQEIDQHGKRRKDNVVVMELVNHVCKIHGHICNFIRRCTSRYK